MADLGAFGKVNLSQLGSLGRVNVASIGSINKIQVVSSVPDSISVYPETVYFYADGTGDGDINVEITSSGAWTSEVQSMGDGIFADLAPTFAGGSTTVTTYCYSWNDPQSTFRTCRIRFTRGTATADVVIYQYDYM